MDDRNKESFGPLSAEIEQGHRRVAEKLQEMTTEVVKVFHAYTPCSVKRVAVFDEIEGVLQSCLAALEDRVPEDERRLNIPPTA